MNDFMFAVLHCSYVYLTCKPKTISSDALTTDEIAFLTNYMPKLGTHVTKKEFELEFTPTNKPLVRNLTLKLPPTVIATDVVMGLLPLLLYSNTLIRLVLQGRTYGKDSPTASWLHELLLRYLRNYLHTYSVGVPCASLDGEGELEITIHSKQRLTKAIGSLNISRQSELSHVAVELVAPVEQELATMENLMRLGYQSMRLPPRFSTRLAPFYAITQTAFYGTKEGFDNDSAFLQGSYIVQPTTISQDNVLLQPTQLVQRSAELNESEVEALLTVIVLMGGSIPCNGEYFNSILSSIASYLNISFSATKSMISTQGYAAAHCVEVIDVDEL